jgi:hypothetical protein
VSHSVPDRRSSDHFTPGEVQALRAEMAKAEIREVLYRYCRGLDRGDAQLIASAYHADAYEEHGPEAGPAAEFAESSARMVADKLLNVQHAVCNVLIDLKGDFAEVESYFLATQRRASRPTIVTAFGGRYLDRFENRDGWRIAARRVVNDWTWRAELPADERTEAVYPRGAAGAADPSAEFAAWCATALSAAVAR